MASRTYFDKLRARKTVLKRTKKSDTLPDMVFYLEWLGSTGKRRVLDLDGAEHVLDDRVVETHYKLMTGKKAKAMIAEHWSKETIAPQAPVVGAKSDAPVSKPKPAKKVAKKAPAKPAKKVAAKPAKKTAKKTTKKATKKAAKKTTKKKTTKKKVTKKKAAKKKSR